MFKRCFSVKEYRYHYLVFFDNGAVRFVRPHGVRICIAQPTDPRDGSFNPAYAHELVRGERREFIRKFFDLYPACPIMNIDVENSVSNVRLHFFRSLRAIANFQLNVERWRSSKKRRHVDKALVLMKDRCLLLVRYMTSSDKSEASCTELNCSAHKHEDEWIFAGDSQRIPCLRVIILVR